MKESTRLGACNCFAVRQAARRITRLYERHLAEAGLTSAQFSILVLLDERGEAAMTGLAHLLAMDRTTLLRAVKPLQREHLIETRRSEADARQLALSLSPAGQRKLKHGMRLWQDAQREFEAQAGSERAARLRRELLALTHWG
jgi:DNA-binding MarR family transcriptional regulator